MDEKNLNIISLDENTTQEQVKKGIKQIIEDMDELNELYAVISVELENAFINYEEKNIKPEENENKNIKYLYKNKSKARKKINELNANSQDNYNQKYEIKEVKIAEEINLFSDDKGGYYLRLG